MRAPTSGHRVGSTIVRARMGIALALVLIGRSAGADVSVKPRGALVVDVGYNSGTFLPGAYGYYVLPKAVSRPQFFLAPSNTVLGFVVEGVALDAESHLVLSAGLDLTLRSPTPLQTGNALAPQFYDAYVRMEGEHLRLTLGQFPDVVIPVAPENFNLFPVGYLPGSLGFARPQARVDLRLPFGNNQVIVQASAATPVQTFDVGGELIGRQAGRPDGQARVAIARGQSPAPWDRPLELGLSAHLGRRLISDATATNERRLTTWSAGADLRLSLPTETVIKARIWWGALLGDYAAGILQTVSPTSLIAIRASGGWIMARQTLATRWRVSAGYGRDDPDDADLEAGERSLNQAAFTYLSFNVTPKAGIGLEVARWGTGYLGLPSSWIWRVDTVSFIRF